MVQSVQEFNTTSQNGPPCFLLEWLKIYGIPDCNLPVLNLAKKSCRLEKKLCKQVKYPVHTFSHQERCYI